MATVYSQISRREMDSLFTAPHVAVQLLWACHGAVFSPKDLQKIILQDSTFCARILSAAAKACPGQIDPLAPLSSALAGLTLPVIKSLAIQSAKRLVEFSFTAPQVQFMRELWFYSQVGSITSRCLAEAISYPDPEEAQVAGLLQNIGMLALFSKNPELYLRDISSSLSSKKVRGEEQVSFATDHLHLADALICGWRLESFMADSIQFLHLDLDQCRESGLLLRIVRLALEICRSPFALNDEIVTVADKFFNLSKKEIETIFNLAQNEYRTLSPFAGDQDECLQEVVRVQKRLTSAVFSIADQEGICSQLVDSVGLETVVETARQLYLYHSAAQEALFFIFDPQTLQFSGVSVAGQSRLVSEMTISLHAGNLLNAAVSAGQLQHSFDRESFDLSVSDRQFIRLCKGQGIVCLPLQVEDKLLGGIVLGVENLSEAQTFAAPKLQLLNSAVARSLAATMMPLSMSKLNPVDCGGDLIAKLVHEVSNPLTIINNYTSLIGPLLEGTENAEILPAVENEIRRIGEILRYYSDLKAAPQQPAAALDLNDLIHSVVESLDLTFFRPKNIRISTDFDPSIPFVKTRSLVIKQILINLLKNAAEALTDEGTISLTTRDYLMSNGEHIAEISIHDTGPGIDKTIQDRLFSPVCSTKGGEHAGLGLNIVKEMVDDINAEISCHSSSEFGTLFKLMIPITGE